MKIEKKQDDGLILIEATDNEKDLILRMRNHEKVRNAMFTNHVISSDEHENWWRRVRFSDNIKILLFKDSVNILGVVLFYEIDNVRKSADWAFYLNNYLEYSNHKMLKIWQKLELSAIDYAKNTMHLNELKAEVFAFNESVIDMHIKFGFKESNRYLRVRNEESIEVICFTKEL